MGRRAREHHDGVMTDNTALDQIAQRSAATGIVRWHDRRMIAGVARGIGARYDVDPVVVRVGFIVTAFLGSLGIAAYLLAWVLLPDDRGHTPLLTAARERAGASIALVVVAALSILGFAVGFGDSGGRFVGLLVLIGIAVLIWRKGESRHTGGAASQATGSRMAGSATSSPAADRGTASSVDGGSDATGRVVTRPVPSADAADTPTAASPMPATTAQPTEAPAGAGPGRPAEMPVITPWGGRDGEHITTYGADAHPSAHAAAPQAARVVTPPVPPRTRRRRLGWRAWLLCGGLALGSYSLAHQIALAQGLGQGPAASLAMGVAGVVVGVAILVIGARGYRTSGVAPTAAIVASLALLAPSASSYVGPDAGMGEVSWRPVAASELDRRFEVGAGEGQLDLTGLAATDLANRTVRAKVGFGELRILVPSDVRVEVRHKVGLGQVKTADVDGTTVTRDGAGVNGTASLGDGPTVVIDLQVGMGEALVERTRR
jgi:phage shock protein PspC (stress-responsive transcriptional regulator)